MCKVNLWCYEWAKFGAQVKNGSSHHHLRFQPGSPGAAPVVISALFRCSSGAPDPAIKDYAANYLNYIFSDRQRDILMLKVVEGLGIVAISKKLGLTHQTVSIQYGRAIKKVVKFSPEDLLFEKSYIDRKSLRSFFKIVLAK